MNRCLTLVQSHVDSSLTKYVSKNMPTYTEIILANCNDNISDDEGVAVKLLNNTDVEATAKERYIERLFTVISEITQVTDPNLWPILINQGIVEFSEANFINYFQAHQIDATITGYINNASLDFDFTTTANDFGAKVAEGLFDAVAVCNDLATDKYRKMLVDLGYYFDNYNADKISNEKFKILIDDNILQMNADSLEFVRDKYTNHLLAFIHQSLNEYIGLQTDETFRLSEVLQIITWDIEDSLKTGLLAFADEPIPIVGKRYSDAVITHIITHNFNAEDKPSLYANYSQYGEQARMAINTLAATAVGANEIITQNMSFDDTLLSVLLNADDVTRNQKIMLFTMSIPMLNEDTCKIHFDELDLSDLKGIFTKSSGRRNYVKSADVTTVLDALKLHGWIYEYYDDERNNDKYIVVKNKPKKEPEILD